MALTVFLSLQSSSFSSNRRKRTRREEDEDAAVEDEDDGNNIPPSNEEPEDQGETNEDPEELDDDDVSKKINRDPKVYYVLPQDVFYCGFCKGKTTMSNIFNHTKFCVKNPHTSTQNRAVNKRNAKNRSTEWNKKNKVKCQNRYLKKVFEEKDHKRRRLFHGDFLSFLSPTNPFYSLFLDNGEESEELVKIFNSVRHCRLACNLMIYLTYGALLIIDKDDLPGFEKQAVYAMYTQLKSISFDLHTSYETKLNTKEKFSQEDKKLVSILFKNFFCYINLKKKKILTFVPKNVFFNLL